MSQVLPLEFLAAGEQGTIVDILGEEMMVHQLAEKGLRKGTMLEVLTAGTPLVCLVNETRLSLRTQDVEVLVDVAG